MFTIFIETFFGAKFSAIPTSWIFLLTIQTNLTFWSELLAVYSFVTLLANSQSVIDFISKFWIISPRLDMVSVEFSIFSSALLTSEIVPYKNFLSPLGIFISLSMYRFISFPIVTLVSRMVLAFFEMFRIAPLVTITSSLYAFEPIFSFNRVCQSFSKRFSGLQLFFRRSISAFLAAILLFWWLCPKLLFAIQAFFKSRRIMTFPTTIFHPSVYYAFCFVEYLPATLASYRVFFRSFVGKMSISTFFRAIFSVTIFYPTRFHQEIFPALFTNYFYLTTSFFGHHITKIKTPLRLRRCCRGNTRRAIKGFINYYIFDWFKKQKRPKGFRCLDTDIIAQMI